MPGAHFYEACGYVDDSQVSCGVLATAPRKAREGKTSLCMIISISALVDLVILRVILIKTVNWFKHEDHEKALVAAVQQDLPAQQKLPAESALQQEQVNPLVVKSALPTISMVGSNHKTVYCISSNDPATLTATSNI